MKKRLGLVTIPIERSIMHHTPDRTCRPDDDTDGRMHSENH
jgi:hypothetical protein